MSIWHAKAANNKKEIKEIEFEKKCWNKCAEFSCYFFFFSQQNEI